MNDKNFSTLNIILILIIVAFCGYYAAQQTIQPEIKYCDAKEGKYSNDDGELCIFTNKFNKQQIVRFTESPSDDPEVQELYGKLG